MPRLLIIEDDENLALTMQDWFKSQNMDLELVKTGREGMEKLLVYSYDVVIMDWGLPDTSGVELLKDFRARGGNTPVLMLTGRSAVDDKEIGFDSGADDYLTKPFSLRELSARIKALMRRPDVIVSGLLKGHGIELDVAARKLTRNGEDIALQPLEFSLLEFFMRHPDQVFTTDALLNRVWPNDSDASVDTLRTCIKKLRRKIDLPDQDSMITNLPGVGYRFDSGKSQ
ncbi:MAG: response regulator transcription factor [Cyanobacteria bacterium SZAS LIN-3]|nr:response regulator transcription factor [Cyanobacteria bacterium SZAS LIN-3]MBS2008994.1 response regulator transcription factor [Cyanobacteria bacterium SZAS TMP-1]